MGDASKAEMAAMALCLRQAMKDILAPKERKALKEKIECESVFA
jgi:hypothetical protein